MDSSVFAVRRSPLRRLSVAFFTRVLLVALLVGASALLVWNEGEAVRTAGEVARSQLPVHEIALDHDTPVDDDEEEEGDKGLVHVVGRLYTPADLHDTQLGVQVRAVKMRRRSEMFQWVETEESVLDENGQVNPLKKFSYTKEWRFDLVNSSLFARFPEHHRNPAAFPLLSTTFTAPLVRVRGLALSPGLVAQIDDFRPLLVEEIPDGFHRSSGFLYRSHDPDRPVVGDVRVRFEVAGLIEGDDEVVSVLARKVKESLEPFVSEDGGRTELLFPGRLSVHDMWERSIAAHASWRWSLRLVGLLLIAGAVSALSKPLARVAGRLALLRELVVAGRAVFCVAASWALVCLLCGARWLLARPAAAVATVAVGVAPIVAVWAMRRHHIVPRHRD